MSRSSIVPTQRPKTPNSEIPVSHFDLRLYYTEEQTDYRRTADNKAAMERPVRTSCGPASSLGDAAFDCTVVPAVVVEEAEDSVAVELASVVDILIDAEAVLLPLP